MGDPKLSTFIVGLILISAAAAILALFMANISTEYAVTYEGNDSLEILNKLGKLNSTVYSAKESTLSRIDENRNIFEKLGDLVGAITIQGISVIKTVFSSFDIFEEMTSSGLGRIGLGSTYDIIKTAIITAVIVTIILGIIISVLVKQYV